MKKVHNINLLYIHEGFFFFADGMLSIALPVYLYKLFGVVSAVFLWYLCWNLLHLIVFIPCFNAALRLKQPRLFLILGIVFYIGSMLCLSYSSGDRYLLVFPGALFFALFTAFYWPVRHWFFSANAEFSKIGSQVSNFFLIRVAVGVIAPILSGMVAISYGIEFSFLCGSVVALFGIIPLTKCHFENLPEPYEFSAIKRIVKKPIMRDIGPAYIWEGVSYQCIALPWLLVFTIYIGDMASLGILVGASALIGALLSKLTGTWFDRRNRTGLLTCIIHFRFITSILYCVIYFSMSKLLVLSVSALNTFAGLMHATINDAYLYGLGSKIDPVEFHINREIYLGFGRTTASLLLWILFSFYSHEVLWIIMFLGAFTIYGYLFLNRCDSALSISAANENA